MNSRTHRRKQSQFEVAFFVLQLCFFLLYFPVLWKFSGGIKQVGDLAKMNINFTNPYTDIFIKGYF